MSRHQKRKDELYEIIFEADTPAGRAFDLTLIAMILLSVGIVMLDSVQEISDAYGGWLYALERTFTIIFTIEYGIRIWIVKKPWRYMRSFYGIIDLLAILPTYLSLFIAGSQYLTVIRALRTIRIWRILKLAHHVSELNQLVMALRASSRKIMVFLLTVTILVMILGSVMYLIESPEAGFTSIPKGIYWAIVTVTTVGYGDISPQTNLGQVIASLAMIMGYAIIAVPTGIVTVELTNAAKKGVTTQVCPDCNREGHDPDAKFCKYCSAELNPET